MLANNKALIVIGIIYIFSTLMCGEHLFWPITIVSFIAIGLRIASATNHIKPLNRLKVHLLSISSFILLIACGIIFRKLGDFFINLLLLGCALKFLEYANKRDTYIQIISIMFLSIMPLVFHYEIYIAIYVILLPILICLSFLCTNHKANTKSYLKTTSKLILPAIPLTIILFIVFPRIGSLWSIPTPSNQATTGISEHMDLSNIAELVESDKIVARVIFEDKIPTDRYFAAITLDEFYGNTAKPSKYYSQMKASLFFNRFRTQKKQQPISNNNNKINVPYTIIMEPTQTNFIPSLKYSTTNETKLFYLDDENYMVPDKIKSREIYRLNYIGPAKFVDYSSSIPKDYLETQLRHFSKKFNPKTQEYVKELTQNLSSDTEKFNALLKVFRNGYTYTHSPGLYSYNLVDELLFTRKKGFCAHYALAFATMLRMAGIPSRIIAGYYSNNFNNNNMLVIKEKDAHTWVEAYIDNKWVFADPVSILDPTLNEAESNPFNATTEVQDLGFFGNIYQFAQDTFEWLDINWSMFILNFDNDSQQNLFKNSIAIIVSIICGGFLIYGLVIYITSFKKPKNKLPKEQELINKLLTILEKHNIKKPISCTFKDFINKVPYSDIKEKLYTICDIYYKIHYRSDASLNNVNNNYPQYNDDIKKLKTYITEIIKLLKQKKNKKRRI